MTNVERHPVGTVVRWTGSGTYTYAAIKTEAGWFTTAREGNPYVGIVYLSLKDLLDDLDAKDDATDIAISTEWKSRKTK